MFVCTLAFSKVKQLLLTVVFILETCLVPEGLFVLQRFVNLNSLLIIIIMFILKAKHARMEATWDYNMPLFTLCVMVCLYNYFLEYFNQKKKFFCNSWDFLNPRKIVFAWVLLKNFMEMPYFKIYTSVSSINLLLDLQLSQVEGHSCAK